MSEWALGKGSSLRKPPQGRNFSVNERLARAGSADFHSSSSSASNWSGFAGPGGQSIPIPDAFYYVTIDPFRYPWDRQSNVNLVCFRFPQDAPSGSELSDFIVSLDVIQDETELTFFPGWDPLLEADLGAAAVVGDDDHDALVPPRHRILEGIQT